MRLTFWVSDKGYEKALGPALIAGAAAHGDTIETRPLAEFRKAESPGIIVGVVRREVLWAHQHSDLPLLYVDKGWPRSRANWDGVLQPVWWRMCWNATHATAYFMNWDRPADRWDRLGIKFGRRQENKVHDHILVIGSSEKFHMTERLDPPTMWTERVVRSIRRNSSRPVVYRPKQTWQGAVPVVGATFDHGLKTSIDTALSEAFCSVTYGSGGCVDSVIAGVPCIVLGNGLAKPISSTYLHDVADPYWAPRARREQWAANLAYCNFSPAEIASGEAWAILKGQMSHAV